MIWKNIKAKQKIIESIRLSKSARLCWIWLGPKNNRGYGTMTYGGENWFAHRVSYTVWKGRIPKGLVVMHSCDNPECVNPAHLKAGTQKENIRDAASKGLMGKISKSDVEKITSLAEKGMHKENIARMFSVNVRTIYRVLSTRYARKQGA